MNPIGFVIKSAYRHIKYGKPLKKVTNDGTSVYMRNNVKTILNEKGDVVSIIKKINTGQNFTFSRRIDYLPDGKKIETETLISKIGKIFESARVNRKYSDGDYKFIDYQRLNNDKIRVMIDDHTTGSNGYKRFNLTEKIYKAPTNSSLESLVKLIESKYSK